MNVLVTGSTSLLGRALTTRLVERGHTVTTWQRNAGDGSTTEVLGDIADPATAAHATRDQDAVIHLAAKVAAIGRWADFERANIDGTRTVFEAARAAGVGRFVHVSTPSVGHHGSALVGAGAAPADPDNTRGHYATSKAVAERFVLRESSAALPVVAIRPHLVWGPGDTQLVGRIVDRARQGRLATIGAGAALIDSTYVDNAADALVAALDHLADNAADIAGQALVVSNGQPRPVAELVERILAACAVADELAPPRLRVPKRVAFVAGLAAERVWDRTGRDEDPPMTSFLAEQLSTAHWFDQRHTQAALRWQPTVTLAEGFERLARHAAAPPAAGQTP